MSRNLFCTGKYEVPMQIPTHLSFMIWSNNDGGPEGVLFRLEQYFRMLHQEEFYRNKNNRKEQDLCDEWLARRLEETAKARKLLKKNPKAIMFGVM